jgi:hypothetical protein
MSKNYFSTAKKAYSIDFLMSSSVSLIVYLFTFKN